MRGVRRRPWQPAGAALEPPTRTGSRRSQFRQHPCRTSARRPRRLPPHRFGTPVRICMLGPVRTCTADVGSVPRIDRPRSRPRRRPHQAPRRLPSAGFAGIDFPIAHAARYGLIRPRSGSTYTPSAPRCLTRRAYCSLRFNALATTTGVTGPPEKTGPSLGARVLRPYYGPKFRSGIKGLAVTRSVFSWAMGAGGRKYPILRAGTGGRPVFATVAPFPG